MNKYTLSILIKPIGNIFHSRLENVNIEIDLKLELTEDFISEYPPNLIRVLETIGDKLGLKYDEKIVVCCVSAYIEPVIHKIVFGEAKKFRRPKEYETYQVSGTEFLIVAYGCCYVYSKAKNIIKKLKLSIGKPEDIFQKIDFDINTIPDNVNYI